MLPVLCQRIRAAILLSRVMLVFQRRFRPLEAFARPYCPAVGVGLGVGVGCPSSTYRRICAPTVP